MPSFSAMSLFPLQSIRQAYQELGRDSPATSGTAPLHLPHPQARPQRLGHLLVLPIASEHTPAEALWVFGVSF